MFPSRKSTIVSWCLQILIAVILAQTLFFKFSGAIESKYIFTAMGMEPWGRYATGVAELIAVILLLWPRTVGIGAVLSLGIISGALYAHATKLGIEILGDNGLLFGLAVVVFIGSAILAWMHRRALPVIGHYFR